MKTEYGVIVLRGVRKDWRASICGSAGGGSYLRLYTVPEEWGYPSACVVWRDRFGRIRAVVRVYANNRSATIRIDANGKWRTTFGDVE